MKKYRKINDIKFARFDNKNLWLQIGSTSPIVYSYDTEIGYIDFKNGVFNTWGYGRYSSTTSKQITQLCNRFKLKRNDIGEIK